jgi:pimeloyl-ACP methyl ester carboxylesterase
MVVKVFNFKMLIYGCLVVAVMYLGLLFGFAQQHKPASIRSARITVFIHGTVGSSFNILNPWQCSSEKCNQNSLSARTVKKFRSFEGMNYDQILGVCGFTEFSPQDLPAWYAARYIIPAYEKTSRAVSGQVYVHKHAVFGWSGLLHNGARKDAGYELYHALCDYRDSFITQNNIDPELDIVSHSHGGNVALWLAQAEKEFGCGLRINCLVMLGTPMHKEMIFGLESPVFSTIVLCHSEGDSIQRRDYFSTKEGKSYQRMADIANVDALVKKHPTLRRHDVACMVNNSDQQVTHTNMWLSGRSNPVLDACDPLPLVVFVPALVHCLGQHPQACAAELYIVDSGESFDVSVHPRNLICHSCKNCTGYDGKKLRNELCSWAAKMKAEWQLSDDTSRHVFFNRKNMQALKHAVWG